MKRMIMIATLLMVGCGSKQQQSDNNETAEVTTPKKVSLTVDRENLPELKMVKPEGETIKIEVVTADKDFEYIKKRGIKIKDAQ